MDAPRQNYRTFPVEPKPGEARREFAERNSPAGSGRGDLLRQSMRRAPLLSSIILAATPLALAGPAAADSFGGFSSIDRSYLVNQDKVCAPLAVTAQVASGLPRCEKAAADRLAQLGFQPGTEQRGPKATFAATATARSLVVTRTAGGEVVRWEAMDPIGKIIEVHADHEDRVAVVYQVRRLGRDMIDVVAFELRGTSSKAPPPGSPADPTSPTKDPANDPANPRTVAPVAPEDPAVTKAAAAARKARGKASSAAWQKVLDLSPQHAEALFRRAALALAAKDKAGALAALSRLASSTQPDAVEWRVAARFDPAFASLRADADFRRAVGLDRPSANPYEKAMGTGGVWEQSGTSCDAPTVAMTFTRDRKFRLTVKSVCEGMVSNARFAGTWRVDGAGLALVLPNRDAADEIVACRFEAAGDEEALRCPLDEDLQIRVLPARR
jgi:hypothetical protein